MQKTLAKHFKDVLFQNRRSSYGVHANRYRFNSLKIKSLCVQSRVLPPINSLFARKKTFSRPISNYLILDKYDNIS